MKLERLFALGKLRKINCYPGYSNLADFHNGQYESEFVSPYTKGSCNVNSEIMVLLKDWTSRDKIEEGFTEVLQYGYTPNLPTNRNLSVLLMDTFQKEIKDVFTTNVFPFIKNGGMKTLIPQADVNKAFKEFCFPQIQIVQPKLVVCSGAQVYKAAISILQPYDDRKFFPINDYFILNRRTLFSYQRSTAAMAINTRGGIKQAKRDWLIMKSNWQKAVS